jgi:hypothetical protein
MSDFRVISSQALNQRFLELCAQAKSQRRGMFAVDVMDSIMTKLRTAPMELGEPVYDLKHLHLQMRHVVDAPWSVYFTVDEARLLVYMSRIDLLT